MNLTDTRKAIDVLDNDLVALLEKRMQLVSEVVAYKKATGKAVFDKEREEAILEKVAARVTNKDFEEAVVATFSDIMKQSRLYQEKQLHD
ncbi:chorismate mutase [Streptococcus hyointestinalis]|uniref:Chorismate mutase n=1 Tax=Streptococcus hyointestinalis TaxID=1337 RepID=A0A380K9R3_9STRE|nr:chorismate mutase [Streptococcus hyointestinalis]MCI6872122.1 chorismate mutase [Streptococcus hyointestinalis]MDD6384182.1 chorismate mutase [Streptococcus hyointestinalis]MDD7357151.1 chorismate mutase [Streptococcus hyointestinalis]MDY4553114.1 chorismate mutase [Streptococcus hyointestinalis]SUN60886.1 chorismate mutase [Streptococcus hyointestinalis]